MVVNCVFSRSELYESESELTITDLNYLCVKFEVKANNLEPENTKAVPKYKFVTTMQLTKQL
jgi:hypothetical protein